MDKIRQNRDEIWIKGHGLALGTFKTYFLELAKCIKEVVSTYFEMFVYKKKSSKMQQGTDFQHIVNLKMQ